MHISADRLIRPLIALAIIAIVLAFGIWKSERPAETAQLNASESLEQLECDPGEMRAFTHGDGPGDTYDSPGQAVSAYAQMMYRPTDPGRTTTQSYSDGSRAQYILKYVQRKKAVVDIAKGPDGKWSVTGSAECSPVSP